jgi:hypothetical protein
MHILPRVSHLLDPFFYQVLGILTGHLVDEKRGPHLKLVGQPTRHCQVSRIGEL